MEQNQGNSRQFFLLFLTQYEQKPADEEQSSIPSTQGASEAKPPTTTEKTSPIVPQPAEDRETKDMDTRQVFVKTLTPPESSKILFGKMSHGGRSRTARANNNKRFAS